MLYFLKKYVGLILFLFCFSGCAWFSHGKKSQESTKIVSLVKQTDSKVVDRKRLVQGGKVVVIPFRAGANVEANEKLDRISLNIIKGLVDVLNTKGSSFEVLTAKNAHEAQFIIEGHITKVHQTSSIRKWALRGHSIGIKVKGKMIDRQTGANILFFSNEKKSKKKQDMHKDLAYLLGRDFGEFIMENSL